MGSSQSSRKLTINNEDGVIQISTDLVQRLSANSKKSLTNLQDDKTPVITPEPIVNQQTSIEPIQNKKSSNEGQAQNYPEYTMTAYKIQQQKEAELKAQDQYWQKRLENVKSSQEKITNVFNEEYKRAIAEISNAKGNKNIDLNTTTPACGPNKDKVLQCYNENPREILKCASLVEEFNNCVDQRRFGLISAKC